MDLVLHATATVGSESCWEDEGNPKSVKFLAEPTQPAATSSSRPLRQLNFRCFVSTLAAILLLLLLLLPRQLLALPDEPFHDFGALKSVARRSRTK